MVTQDGRIVFLSLRARNYDNTVRFYRDVVGIHLEVTAHSDEGPHAEYSWHNPYFHFAVVPAGSQEEPTRTEIALNYPRRSIRAREGGRRWNTSP